MSLRHHCRHLKPEGIRFLKVRSDLGMRVDKRPADHPGPIS